MKTVTGNIWSLESDYICVTTNGDIHSNRKAIMGAGIALEARERSKLYNYDVEAILGSYLYSRGNHVAYLGYKMVSFPTKQRWKERSSLKLIEQSANELSHMFERFPDNTVVLLPPPGCGNGGLNWHEVEPILSPILDDKFTVVFKTASNI